MKKAYIFSFVLVMLCLHLTAQVTEKYHLVRELKSDSISVSQYCSSGTTTSNSLKLNISIENKLPVGTVFIGNLEGSYYKYWVVIESKDTKGTNVNATISGSYVIPRIIDICNDPKTYKFHRLQYIGNTLAEVNNKYCNFPTSAYAIKADIMTAYPLKVGEVIHVNRLLDGNPSGYYYVKHASVRDGTDEDVNVNDDSRITSVNLEDNDGDGVPNICDNCPNRSNSNQADRDGDGIGDVCDDSDGDGVRDAYDDCPTDPGPSSNNGCPEEEGEPDLVLDKTRTSISSDCLTCPSTLSDLGTQRHVIKKQTGTGITINQIAVKNNGDEDAGSSTAALYLSSDNNLDSGDSKFNATISVSSISAGSRKTTGGTSLYNYQFTRSNGNYYLLLVLDDTESVSESNENNNVTAIPITLQN